MAETADIIVVGAGIIGLNTAFQIALRTQARIVVLDKGKGPGEGSTGASSAVCRFKYSYDEMVLLAKHGVGAYQQWADYTKLKDPRAQFHKHGMLWLANASAVQTESEAERLAGLGIRATVLDDQELRTRFPSLNEPPRDYRRPFGLSYAAMETSSSMA